MIPILLAVALQPAAADSAAGQPPTVAARDRITFVSIDAPGDLGRQLAEAVRLRRPGTKVTVARRAPPQAADAQHAHVRVRPKRGVGRYSIAVTTSAGATYKLNVRADKGAAPRTLASDLALLLRGVEEGTAFPAAKVEAPLPPEEPTPKLRLTERTQPPEFDLWLDPALAVGLAPAASGPASLAGGGSLALGARTRRSVWVGGRVRVLGAVHRGHSLVRTSIGVAAGYVVTQGRFELPVLGIVGVEPWFVSDAGGSTSLQVSGSSSKPSPLLGAGLSLTPAYVWRRGRNRISLGATVELDAAGDVAHRMRTPRVRDENGSTIFRLGGLELFGGLHLSVGVRGRSRR